MTDLIERMAKALYEHTTRGPLPWGDDLIDRKRFRADALAALSALLPPDPEAVRRVAYETDITPETVEAIWTRMVELSGPPPESGGP